MASPGSRFFVEVDMDNWNKDFGMEIIKDYTLVEIAEIKVNKEYQRNIEPLRLRGIVKSIEKYGFWPSEVIILNELKEAVDGNHRVAAAKKLGLFSVPCSIVTFPTKNDEIRFFSHKNSWNTSLKPVDAWEAKYKAEHPLAELIYMLECDEVCKFCNKIAIKNKANKSTKFSIPDAIVIINASAFMNIDPWKQQIDYQICEKINSMKYIEIADATDSFLSMFFAIFGEHKNENTIAYRSDSIRAYCKFYISLMKSGVISTTKKRQAVINKMKTMAINQAFLKADYINKYLFFATHYNNKKSIENRITI